MTDHRLHGRFQATREGFGFITPIGGGAELYVPASEVAGALHGDLVVYEVIGEPRGTFKAEAAVIAVLERGARRFTGVVAGSRRHFHLVPDHYLLPDRLRLVGSLQGVAAGQRVLCRVHESGPGRAPGAMLERILGDAEDPRIDDEIVRGEFGLAGPFPDEVLAEAARARVDGAPARRDFSDDLVITIDPADARDFDDAVSLAPWPGGGWLLRVHIADVAEDVPAGGVVDQEARRRGNSTYLPGSMIPMLPEVLCTDRLSLARGEVRRVVTVSARVSDVGVIRSFRFDEGLIRSRWRLSYRQVQAVLDGAGSIAPQVDALVRDMDRLAQRLRARRFRHGGFELVLPEVRVTVDDRGAPVAIARRLPARSHQLIEEFMILANRLACAFAVRRGHPYLYRVHPPPDPLGIEEFRDSVSTLAPEVKRSQLTDMAALRRWLAGLAHEPRTWRIHALFLRSFMRAIYADRDTGHFGLGLRGYGHFTSPIRRYPDLFNHRVVKWAIRAGTRPVPQEWREEAAALALACTGTEERSERAEREMVRIKCLRWAEAHLGDSFRGTIVAVLPRGLIVELDDPPVDGFVARDDVEGALVDRGRGPRLGSGRGGIQVGMPVIVQIARVDLRHRSLLLALRALGRRAQEIDPARMAPLVEPWGSGEGCGGRRPGGRRPGRKAGRPRKLERPGRGMPRGSVEKKLRRPGRGMPRGSVERARGRRRR
jgi:ribonuclease R